MSPVQRNWLVIANASRARILEESDRAGHYTPVAVLVRPQSRLKGEQLGDDRSDRVEHV